MVMAYVKGKQTTFVQSNKTQVYLFHLFAPTCKIHVLAVLRPSSLNKSVNIRRGHLDVTVSSCISSCVDIPEYWPSISRNM
jgi:hypothetical protein